MMRLPETSNSRLPAVLACLLAALNLAQPSASAAAASAGAAAPTPAASAGSAAAQSAIKSARLSQNAAIAAHRIDVVVSYWTDDVTICRGLGAQLAGKAAYRKLFEEDNPSSPDVIVYERIPTSIDVSGTWPLAFESGKWQGHRGGARGPVVIEGRYSAQWINRGGQWLIRAEVFVALAGFGPGLEMKAAP